MASQERSSKPSTLNKTLPNAKTLSSMMSLKRPWLQDALKELRLLAVPMTTWTPFLKDSKHLTNNLNQLSIFTKSLVKSMKLMLVVMSKKSTPKQGKA